MKFSFLQSDFSAGELSPRAQGHTDSDAYKAGAGRMANVVTTPAGSVASRAGLKLLTDGKLAPLPSGNPTVLLGIADGPFGDFQLEVQTQTQSIRMLTRWGAVPFTPWLDVGPFMAANSAGPLAWTDIVERKIFIGDIFGSLTFKPDFTPLGTLQVGDTCTVSMIVAGVGGIITQSLNGVFVAGVGLNPGLNTFTFQPLLVNQFVFTAPSGPVEIRGLQMYKSAGTGFAGAIFSLPAAGIVGGLGTRAEAFWTNGNEIINGYSYTSGGSNDYLCASDITQTDIFYIFFCGPGMVLQFLSWNRLTNTWLYGTPTYEGVWGDNEIHLAGGGTSVPTPLHSTQATTPDWMVPGAVLSMKAYQGRLWLGLSEDRGTLKATRIGYGKQNLLKFHYNIANVNFPVPAVTQTVEQIATMGPVPHLSFKAGNTVMYTLDSLTSANPLAGQCILPIPNQFPAATTYTVYLKRVATGLVYRLAAPTYTIADPSYGAETVRCLAINTVIAPAPVALPWSLVAGDQIWLVINNGVPASDALDLSVARPAGAIPWIEELRGLLLGTSRSERIFSTGSLAIDPVSGAAFELTKYSTHGADKALGCLAVQDKIVFVTPGRKRLRMMGQSITTNGGLVASDLSVLGEHLLAKKIRSMCFLRAPVPRLVFAFDDGTGAIATLNDDKMSLAWARFSLGAPYDIYSVSATDTPLGTELYVSTSNGSTMVVLDVDSTVPLKTMSVYPYTSYDYDQPPPVMDAWVKVPCPVVASAVFAGLPAVWVGFNAAVILNGAPVGPGPFPVISDGAGGGQVTLPVALSATWVDAKGKNQAQNLTIGIFYPEHRVTTLPLEGGNPVGTAQNLTSRKPQLWARFVDSYLPLINGTRAAERNPGDLTDAMDTRVTGDRRATELNFQQAAVVDIVMDLPLRMEISALFGGVVMNNL